MIELSAWIERYVELVGATFGNRVRFVGLQGSHGRGEATEASDIDMVVVLDTLDPADIAAYDAMLDALDHRELACGFLCGWEELLRWEPSDLFQFCHDTTPLLGSLDDVLARVGPDAVDRAIRIGACNIYHGCVHNLLYEKDADILRGLLKAATFVVRACVYRRTGTFCRRLDALMARADETDLPVLSAWIGVKNGQAVDFGGMSETLFAWAKGKINMQGQ